MAKRKTKPDKQASTGSPQSELPTVEQPQPHPKYPDRDERGRILPGHHGPGRKPFRTTLRDMFVAGGEEVPTLDDNFIPTNAEGLSRMEIVIRKLYNDAANGDNNARDFIFDRIGGKVPVTIETDWRHSIRSQVIGLLLSGQTTIELVRETFSETLFNELFAEYAQSGGAGASGLGQIAPAIIEGSLSDTPGNPPDSSAVDGQG